MADLNYGMLTNISNGIREGLMGYQTAKQIKRQEEMQNLMQGVQRNAETGELEFTPEKKALMEQQKAKREAEMQASQRQLQMTQPESEISQRAIQTAQGLLGSGSEKYLTGMSAAELKEMQPLIASKMRQQGMLERATKEPMLAGAKDASSLRKEFNARPEVKNYREVNIQADKIENAIKSKSPAGDMSMIFAYMKLLDPNSTVREGEYATAQNATSIPDAIRNAYNRAATGEKLNEKQRQDFFNQAQNLVESHRVGYQKAYDEYADIAKLQGIDTRLIFGSAKPPQARQAPQFESDVIEYAKSHNISPEEAQNIKLQRGGKAQSNNQPRSGEGILNKMRGLIGG